MAARLDIKGMRDAQTLAMLRDAYKQGTKVEAVKVRDVATGVVGVVREVKADGSISILWNTGEIGEAEYGLDSVRIVNTSKCMVKRKPDDQACSGDKCSECGWNEEVHKERLKRIRDGEMIKRKTETGEELFLVVKKGKTISAASKVLNS